MLKSIKGITKVVLFGFLLTTFVCDSSSDNDSQSGAPLAVSYQVAVATFPATVAISDNTPTVLPAASVTTPISFAIDPELPDGLSLDEDGTISGTPLDAWGPITFTVTATNSEGSATEELTFTSTNVSLSGQVQPIFTSTCSGCHPGSGVPDIVTDAATTHANIVGVDNGDGTDYITASDSANSWIYIRMAELNDESVMPTTGRLDDASLATVKLWIDQGAPNN